MRKLLNEELNRKSVQEFHASEKHPIIIVLDNVRSLNNVGSTFRTADAFLLQAIYLCGITGTPPNKEIEKTALGATHTVAWKHFDSTLQAVQQLKDEGYTVIAVEQVEQSIPLDQYQSAPNQRTALIFGHEVHGVDQAVIDACDQVIEIPQGGSKHSLNIAVCVGILAWEFLPKASSSK